MKQPTKETDNYQAIAEWMVSEAIKNPSEIIDFPFYKNNVKVSFVKDENYFVITGFSIEKGWSISKIVYDDSTYTQQLVCEILMKDQ